MIYAVVVKNKEGARDFPDSFLHAEKADTRVEYAGYRTFCVFFNANGASIYRASLAFIFSEMIFEGGQKVL